MRPPLESDIALAASEGPTAYERARTLLRLGDLAADAATKLIMHVPAKPVRDPTAVSEQAMTQAVLYLRKKYSEG